jgi:E3 ubiquitin-protein ligase TRIP12
VVQALQKMSVEHSGALLKEGGLMAVLAYLDFFSLAVQRTSVITAANICRSVPEEYFCMVTDAIPNLSNLLSHHDQQVIEQTFLAFVRLADSCFSTSNTRYTEHHSTLSALQIR